MRTNLTTYLGHFEKLLIKEKLSIYKYIELE